MGVKMNYYICDHCEYEKKFKKLTNKRMLEIMFHEQAICKKMVIK